MKKSELKDIRTRDINELAKKVQERKMELEKVKAEIKTQHEKNLKKAKKLRRDLAQILTVIKEKQILEKEK